MRYGFTPSKNAYAQEARFVDDEHVLIYKQSIDIKMEWALHRPIESEGNLGQFGPFSGSHDVSTFRPVTAHFCYATLLKGAFISSFDLLLLSICSCLMLVSSVYAEHP